MNKHSNRPTLWTNKTLIYGKLLKQASGDAKQQHQQQQHLIRASSVYEAAVSDSRSTLSRL
ncbi:hypothetical protein F2Q69_00047151 [Brassica cretica]|uniref:Uncharacterized protein n=1 Tax=Brassica cretica TaxID=69181 RepID=A0A8S9Q7R4_BRACR|nr:hypothetical protein F2Q69_00047151 [Brassica cretica]